MRATNLFSYATSELSQDAFICWLLSHASKDGWDEDPQLRECACEFLDNILQSKNFCFKASMRAEVKKQYKNIDVLVVLDDIYIIIEDKKFTSVHNDQINRYKDTLIKEGVRADNIICVFYKILEQASPEKNVDFEYTREILLDLFRTYNQLSCNQNPIFRDYLEYLEYVEDKVKSYQFLPIEDWSSDSYIGFFTHLKKSVFKDEEVSWGYVSNPSGGFMGLWWFDILDSQRLNDIGLTEELCDELYLQLEDNIITVKYALEDRKYKERKYDMDEIQAIRWKIYDYFKSELGDSFVKKPFKSGQYMTIGYMKYTEKNYKEVFSRLKNTLLNLDLRTL